MAASTSDSGTIPAMLREAVKVKFETVGATAVAAIARAVRLIDCAQHAAVARCCLWTIVSCQSCAS